MSTLDQPLLIANVNYHVGHWVAIYVAEEQGFFNEKFDEAAAIRGILAYADLAAAEFAHVGDVFGAIPLEKWCVAPTADNVDICALHTLGDR